MRRFTPLEKLCKNVIIDEEIDEQQQSIADEDERENDVLPVDEGYEEELICLQSVNEFNNCIMFESSAEEQQEMETWFIFKFKKSVYSNCLIKGFSERLKVFFNENSPDCWH